jgi:hypothetical protein
VTEIQFSENAPRVRKNFSKIPAILEIPNLNRDPEAVVRTLPADPDRAREARDHRPAGRVQLDLPIKDFNDTASLEFVG